MKSISPTTLRENVYKILDTVIQTGRPQKIHRKGYILEIMVDKKIDKLANLKPHNVIVGDPDDLINLSVGEWTEEKNL